jgi:hypothetical protein
MTTTTYDVEHNFKIVGISRDTIQTIRNLLLGTSTTTTICNVYSSKK